MFYSVTSPHATFHPAAPVNGKFLELILTTSILWGVVCPSASYSEISQFVSYRCDVTESGGLVRIFKEVTVT